MAQVKKILAGALALCMAGSMLTACGGDTDSTATTSDTKTESKTESKTDDKKEESKTDDKKEESKTDDKKEEAKDEEKKEEPAAPATDLVNTGKKYNVYCWNDEFKSRFEKYYESVKDTALWDGVEVNWIINSNEGNVYQTKLDEAIAGQMSAAEDDRIDLFLVEADYALKYVNQDIALDVKSEVGLTDDDLANQYQYTKDVMTDSNGVLKGVSWQATPGLFMYNAEVAKDVLGTDDPEKVQAELSDWDKFTAVAEKAKAKGYAMVSGFDDTYRCFSNNVSAPWVTDNKITIDPQIKAWVDQTKDYTDKGYNNKTSLWNDAWAAGQKIDGKTFGYFFSTWGIAFTLKDNTGEDGFGKWRACAGPQPYFWGGTWICGAYGSDNIAITRDIMLKLTCDKDTMKAITEGEQDYTNNKAAIKELIDGGYSNDFLGGQNHLALLTDAADNIDLSNKLSAYDQGCNEEFQGAMKDYFLGNVSYDEALANFKTKITTKYNTLTMD